MTKIPTPVSFCPIPVFIDGHEALIVPSAIGPLGYGVLIRCLTCHKEETIHVEDHPLKQQLHERIMARWSKLHSLPSRWPEGAEL